MRKKIMEIKDVFGNLNQWMELAMNGLTEIKTQHAQGALRARNESQCAKPRYGLDPNTNGNQ